MTLFTRKRAVTLLRWSPAILIVIGLSYLLAIRPIQIRMERNRFEAMAVEVQKVADQIVAKIGKPDQTKTVHSCGYASRVYGNGPRSCGTSVYMLYENKDHLQATELAQKAIPMFGDAYKLGEMSTEFLPSSMQSLRQGFSIPTQKDRCTLEYRYPMKSDAFSVFSTTSQENLFVVVNCAASAMAEHYLVI